MVPSCIGAPLNNQIPRITHTYPGHGMICHGTLQIRQHYVKLIDYEHEEILSNFLYPTTYVYSVGFAHPGHTTEHTTQYNWMIQCGTPVPAAVLYLCRLPCHCSPVVMYKCPADWWCGLSIKSSLSRFMGSLVYISHLFSGWSNDRDGLGSGKATGGSHYGNDHGQ